MKKTPGKRVDFWTVVIPGWFLFVIGVYAQGVAAFDYDLSVAMGTQEPATMISEIGAAFWRGFAVGDASVYLPLLALGLTGFAMRQNWGRVLLAAALGVTIYWPVVSLATVVFARGAAGWNLASESGYWAVLPIIALWGAWGLFRVMRQGAS